MNSDVAKFFWNLEMGKTTYNYNILEFYDNYDKLFHLQK